MSKTKSSTKPTRRKPVQKRALVMVDAILQATFELIEKNGYAELTTNDIAEYAGVSIGSLYQYFPNREAVINALYEQIISKVAVQARDVIFKHVADDIEQVLPELIDAVLSLYEENEVVLVHLLEEVPYLRKTAQSLSLEMLIQSANRVYITQHYPNIQAGDVETKLYFACNTFLEHIRKYVLEKPENITRATFITNLAGMIIAYLQD